MEGIKSISLMQPAVKTTAPIDNSLYAAMNTRVAKRVSADQFVARTAQTAPVEPAVNNWVANKAPKLFMKKYLSPKILDKALAENPNIKQILLSKNLPCEYNIENITGKNQEHFLTTYQKAKELGKNLPENDYNALIKAALLHDVGKAFIPPEILNKNGKLTPEEKDIVDIHAQLGYEILKTSGLSPKVYNLVGMHHTNCDNPIKRNNVSANILSAADVYSALKEKRSYKPEYDDEKVKDIMSKDPKLEQAIVQKCF